MVKVKINQSLAIHTPPTSETILEAMEHAGLDVEYHCRDGHCGACRCKLVSGNVKYVGFAMAYTQEDEILPCVCQATEDIELSEVRCQQKVKRA